MNLTETPTRDLVDMARQRFASQDAADDILMELGVRYGYEDAPKEDRALILEFDRLVVIPLFGYTKLPPGLVHLPGAKLASVPAYYKIQMAKEPVHVATVLESGSGEKSSKLKKPGSIVADFFISYSSKDLQTVRYLKQWLEEAGYTTFMQESDFPPTSHIIEKMEEGMNSPRLLAVLSDNYLQSDYCKAEFGAALMRDPLNKTARIVIVRISKCDVPVLWGPISRIELTGAGGHIRDMFFSAISKLPAVDKRLEPKKAKHNSAKMPPVSGEASAAVSAHASGPGSVAAAAGRDVHFHYGTKKPPRGQPKAPVDVISEDQAAKLKALFDEVVELDSASPEGKELDEGELIRKWWGGLGKAVPGSGYRNYSQSKYKRAMEWLRQHRARLASGAANEEPAMAAGVMIRGIHTYISRNSLDKRSCYDDWSRRLGISPPFQSTKDLSPGDLKRVYGAMRRDAGR